MSCKHVYDITIHPKKGKQVLCTVCNAGADNTICANDAHKFITLFPSVAHDHYPWTICENCGHSGAEIISLGGRPTADV